MTTSTAFWIAAVRAREAARPDRLFNDPHARDLAGDRGFAIMAASERAAGGENAYIPVRVRWFDDLIVSAVPGMRQVVVLGAGLDTRPYRLDMPADLDWYEVDRQDTFAAKQDVLAGCVPRCRRHVVVGEIGADWRSALLGAGFDQEAPTLWLAEGLFFYLSEETIVGMLRGAAALCGAGSLFAADVTGTAGLDCRRWSRTGLGARTMAYPRRSARTIRLPCSRPVGGRSSTSRRRVRRTRTMADLPPSQVGLCRGEPIW